MTLYSVTHALGQSLIEAEDEDHAEEYATELFGTQNGPYAASTNEGNIGLAKAFGARIYKAPLRGDDE